MYKCISVEPTSAKWTKKFVFAYSHFLCARLLCLNILQPQTMSQCISILGHLCWRNEAAG